MEKAKIESVLALKKEGRSYRDIAEIEGISSSSVYNIIQANKHLVLTENTQAEEQSSSSEEVKTVAPKEDVEIFKKSNKKTKSKKGKKEKAMKKKMAKVQNDLLKSQKELEKSQFEAKCFNETLLSRDQEIRLQQELSDYLEKVVAFDGKALKYNAVLDTYNFLWEWKEEVSTVSLFKAFKEEYALATKLSDHFEKGLRKFDESKLLKKVRFNFSPEVISQVQSYIIN